MVAGSDPCSCSEIPPRVIGDLSVNGRRVVLRFGPTLLAGWLLTACAPKLDAGEWQCPSDAGAVADPSPTDPVDVPWSAGFEDRFCDYQQFAGYCYGDSPYTRVTEPVHAGRFAAEFVARDENDGMQQTRCVRRGVLPDAAYYAAWYYVPVAPTVPKNEANPLWNLIHFQGGESPTSVRKLWDVSLIRDSRGDWDLLIFDPISGRTFRAPDPSPIPIGEWFHIQLFLKRSAGTTGALSLYQDGELLIEATNLRSDHSNFTEWYVGNLATGFEPPALYVDDVSISAAR